MANVNVTSNAWTEISITSGTVQNISATADIELSAEQTDNSGVVLKPSELYQWDNETIYARAVTEETGALRVVNFKKATGGGGGYVLPVATASTLGGVKIGSNLSIDGSGVLSATGGATVNYSTTEQQIGTWIDGKPLYQITITTNMPVVATQGIPSDKSVDISSLMISKVVDIKGFVYISGSFRSNSINSTSSFWLDGSTVKAINRFVDVDNDIAPNTYVTRLFLRTTVSEESEQPCYVTLQYTKTTD